MLLKLENEDTKKEEIEKKINEKNKRYLVIKIILLIFIIVLLLVLYLCCKIGKIGFVNFSVWEGEEITITDSDLQIIKDTNLNIFNTKKIKGEKVIQPMSNGSYKFTIKNDSNYNMIYNMKFSENMTNIINMKYRLKINNIYIKGNEKEYVSINDLGVESIVVPRKSIDVYTLEWNWESDDAKDTKIGIQENDQYYTFRLEVFANIYDKEVKKQ